MQAAACPAWPLEWSRWHLHSSMCVCERARRRGLRLSDVGWNSNRVYCMRHFNKRFIRSNGSGKSIARCHSGLMGPARQARVKIGQPRHYFGSCAAYLLSVVYPPQPTAVRAPVQPQCPPAGCGRQQRGQTRPCSPPCLRLQQIPGWWEGNEFACRCMKVHK